MDSIEQKEVKTKLKWESFEEKLGSFSWYFRDFWEMGGFDPIYKKLKEDSGRGKIIIPDSKDTFRVFSEVEKSKLKVIWYLQDPYATIKNNIKIACGVAMDCRNTGKLQPSLELFYNAIESTVYNGLNLNMEKPADTTYLLQQGVMLLNTDLTCEAGKSSSHEGLWEPFQKYFIEEIINKYHPGTIFVLSGQTSQKLEKYIAPMMHYVIKTEHPAAASRNYREWDCNNAFNKINTILKENNGITSQITWGKDQKEEWNDLPFDI